MKQKLTFSGHESFICKQFWLKKVYDFVSQGMNFNDENAVVQLGVGKNMVASLRYWGRAFGILDEHDKLSPLANYLFEEAGNDEYLEDFGTLWLLHYNLVKTNKFSISSLIFNDFRKERIEFTKEQLINFLIRKSKEHDTNTDSEKTIERDVNVFIRMYSKPQRGEEVEIEDDFSGVLIDSDLVKRYKQRGLDGKLVEWYKVDSEERLDIPFQIVLYTILDNFSDRQSISFRELLTGPNSPGAIFALNADGLFNKLQQIAGNYPDIVYSETAGNQILQFKSPIDKFEILNGYYN